jgi:hypothetical protein
MPSLRDILGFTVRLLLAQLAVAVLLGFFGFTSVDEVASAVRNATSD